MICEYGDWLAVHMEVKVFAAPNYGERLMFRLAMSLFRCGEVSICWHMQLLAFRRRGGLADIGWPLILQGLRLPESMFFSLGQNRLLLKLLRGCV